MIAAVWKSVDSFGFQTNALEKGMNPLIPPAMGHIVLLLFFCKPDISIK